jgi:hypothetical protein
MSSPRWQLPPGTEVYDPEGNYAGTVPSGVLSYNLNAQIIYFDPTQPSVGLAHRLYRNLEEFDRRSAFGSPRIHRVERLVAAAHSVLALEERESNAFASLPIDEHEHFRALQPGRGISRLDLGSNHFDCVVDLGRVALERRHACVHVSSQLGRWTSEFYAARAQYTRASRLPRSPARARAEAARNGHLGSPPASA